MIFDQPNIKHLLSKHNTFVYVSATHRQQQHHFIYSTKLHKTSIRCAKHGPIIRGVRGIPPDFFVIGKYKILHFGVNKL